MAKEANARKKGSKPSNPKRLSQSATTLAGAGAAAIAAVCFGASHFTMTNPSTMEPPPPIERKPPVEKPPVEKPPVEKPPVEKPPVEQAASARPAAPTRDPSCADKAPECGQWASIGECDANPGYMMVSCASSCNMCDMLDYRKRCAVDETVPNPNPNPDPDPNPDPTLTLTLTLSPNPNPNPDPNPNPSPNRIPYPTQVPLSVGPGAMDETFRLASGAAFAHLEPSVLSADPWVLQFDA
jgi:hypothetical protein